MHKVHKVIGPPGTGKTTFLVREAIRACGKLRKGNCVLVTSLTRAAAHEFRSRIPAEIQGDVIVGTLHSHALRALGRPNIIKPTDIEDWNRDHPQFQLPKNLFSENQDDVIDQAAPRCDFWLLYHMWRSCCIPVKKWPGKTVPQFAALFDAWKRENDLVDFTDLIEFAVDVFPAVSPQVIFVDEAQDHDALQWRLLMAWSRHPECEHLILVGDPAQNLYEWRGSEATAMEEATKDDPEVEVTRRVLSKSYRVPSTVLNVALKIRNRMTDVIHDDYQPRDGDAGKVNWIECNLRKEGGAKKVIEIVQSHMVKRKRESMMVLATCGYMLKPLIAEMRNSAIPYCNPFKASNPAWNPLSPPPRGIGWLQRLEAFLSFREKMEWTYYEIKLWIKLFRMGKLCKRGSVKELEKLAQDEPRGAIGFEDFVSRYLERDSDIQELLADEHKWILRWCRTDYQQRVHYAMQICNRWGREYLHYRGVIVGTVHSVKGGESDHVYLCNEMSFAECQSYQSSRNGKNQIHRKFYVGATRARQSLTVLEYPGNPGEHCYPV